MRAVAIALLALTMVSSGCIDAVWGTPEPDEAVLEYLEELSTFPEWRLETNQGTIRAVLYVSWLPETTASIIRASDTGYYAHTTMYRVIDDFVLQGGDEDEGDEQVILEGGGVPLEVKEGVDFGTGAIGLARSVQTDSGTTHYFITEKPALHLSQPDQAEDFLANPSENGALRYGTGQGQPYALFGQVFEGMDIVRQIATVATDENDRPLTDVSLFDAQVFNAPQDADLLNLIPDVYGDVVSMGHTGVFEAPRVVVTDHPATFLFTVRGDDCGNGSYVLVHPDGDRAITDWDKSPHDECTYQATHVFDDEGTYTFDLGAHEFDITVHPWSNAYEPYAGSTASDKTSS